MLLLAGSAETHLVGKGAFQELDAVVLLESHTKLAIRPACARDIPHTIENAFRTARLGRAGVAFVDLPADLIQAVQDGPVEDAMKQPIPKSSEPSLPADKMQKAAHLIRDAKAPLIVVGKGAAYARAEEVTRELIERWALTIMQPGWLQMTV